MEMKPASDGEVEAKANGLGGGGEKEEVDKDQIIEAIGDFGKWQFHYFLLLCLVGLPTGFPVLGITFLAANTEFWCARPPGFEHLEPGEWRNASSPLITQGGKETRDQCNVWNR